MKTVHTTHTASHKMRLPGLKIPKVAKPHISKGHGSNAATSTASILKKLLKKA